MRFWIACLVALFCVLPYSTPVLAQTNVEKKELPAVRFAMKRDITYTVSRSVHILVEESVTITNLASELYPKSFKLLLESADIDEIYAEDALGQILNVNVGTGESESQTVVEVQLPESFGKEAEVAFKLMYRLNESAKHLGEITEFTLPRFNAKGLDPESRITVLVDTSLQDQTFMFPRAEEYSLTGDYHRYEFSAASLNKTGVKAIFGKRQLYSFVIFYHLDEEEVRGGFYELELPPDTNYQRIFLTEFSQQPREIYVDEDGNWIGKFAKGEAHSPIVVKGTAMVFPEPVNQIGRQGDSKQFLKADTYWEVNDPAIRELADSLDGIHDVYEYVVNELTYTYDKPGEADSRQGAKTALEKPRFANCMEFTDLFIALARAKGVPARRVVGYAHSENPTLQPLSLQADVLHAWPEYWDSDLGVWKAVDPTWQSTSRGVDYFSTWDARHIGFVINGSSSTEPLPPGSAQSPSQSKNILVTPVQSILEEQKDLKVEVVWSPLMLPLLPYQGELVVKNVNQYAEHSIAWQLQSTDSYEAVMREGVIDVLPPHGETRVRISARLKQLWMMDTLVVELGGKEYQISVSTQYRVWQKLLFGGMLLLYACIAGVTVIIARKAWGVSVSKRGR